MVPILMGSATMLSVCTVVRALALGTPLVSKRRYSFPSSSRLFLHPTPTAGALSSYPFSEVVVSRMSFSMMPRSAGWSMFQLKA